jgi:hypothetical protein
VGKAKTSSCLGISLVGANFLKLKRIRKIKTTTFGIGKIHHLSVLVFVLIADDRLPFS